jgi:hypothetical protein
MKIDEKILKEISRYNFINNYLMEQAPPPPPLDAGAPPPPAGAGAPPPPAGAGAPPPPAGPPPPAPVDVDADTDVELVDGDAEDQGGDTEELDITDLVDTQKTMADKQEEYFTSLFDQIKNMEEKLSEMDKLVSKIDSLETKFDKFRPKTPQEKLELRSLDSGPFKQNLSDFFDEKKENKYAISFCGIKFSSNNG